MEIGRQLQGRGGDYDGAALGAKLLGEFANAAADAVVIAIASKILEQKGGIPQYQSNICQSLLGIIGVIDGSAAEFRQSGGYAPSIKRYGEFRGYVEENLLEAFLLRGLNADNRMTGIHKEAELIVLVGVNSRGSGHRIKGGGGRICAGCRRLAGNYDFWLV